MHEGFLFSGFLKRKTDCTNETGSKKKLLVDK